MFRSPTSLTWVAAVLAAGAIAAPAAAYVPRIHAGTPFSIPSIGLHGRLTSSLAAGPVEWWHDADTVAIAGHDVTPVPGYGAHGPFWTLYRVTPGDLVYVGVRVYRVRFVTDINCGSNTRQCPRALWILRWRGLVLSECWPRYTAQDRKVVLARLVSG